MGPAACQIDSPYARTGMRYIEAGERRIGTGYPCFIIAEAGVNHDGEIHRAFQLVDIAKSAGADAVNT